MAGDGDGMQGMRRNLMTGLDRITTKRWHKSTHKWHEVIRDNNYNFIAVGVQVLVEESLRGRKNLLAKRRSF